MTLLSQEYTVPSDSPVAAEFDSLITHAQVAPPGIVTELVLSPSTLRIDGAGNTWVWRLDERNHLSYFVLGDVMFLSFFLAFTTTLPTAVSTFYVTLPDGYQVGSTAMTPAKGLIVPVWALDGSGTLTNVIARVDNPTLSTSASRNRFVSVLRTSGSYTAGASTIAGQLWFEVRPFGGV